MIEAKRLQVWIVHTVVPVDALSPGIQVVLSEPPVYSIEAVPDRNRISFGAVRIFPRLFFDRWQRLSQRVYVARAYIGKRLLIYACFPANVLSLAARLKFLFA